MSGAVSALETRAATSVATTAALSDIDTTPFSSGELAYTQDTKQFWFLDRTSTEAPSATVLLTRSGVGRWVEFFSSAEVPFGIVPNIAALALIDDTVAPNGAERFVLTVLQPWILDKTSSLTVDGITIAATESGIGRWVRILTPNPKWTAQQDWNINALIGNDENDGFILPLKTVAEFCRRVRIWKTSTLPVASYNIHLLTDIPATDAFRPGGEPDPTSSGHSVESSLFRLLGQLIPVDGTSSFVGTAAFGVVATSTPPTFTDGAIDFTPFVGKLLRILSTGITAKILDAPVPGTAITGDWTAVGVLGFDVTPVAPPAPGTAYDIVDRTIFAGDITGGFGVPSGLTFNIMDVEIPPGEAIAIQTQWLFTRCRIRRQITSLPFPQSVFSSIYVFPEFDGTDFDVDDGSPITLIFESLSATKCLFRNCALRNVSVQSKGNGVQVLLVDTTFFNGRAFTSDSFDFAGPVRTGGNLAFDSLKATIPGPPVFPFPGCGFFGTIPGGAGSAAVRGKSFATIKNGTGVAYGVVAANQFGIDLKEGSALSYVNFGFPLVPVFSGGTEFGFEAGTAVPTVLSVPTGPAVALNNFGTGAGGLRNPFTFAGAAMDYRNGTKAFPIG